MSMNFRFKGLDRIMNENRLKPKYITMKFWNTQTKRFYIFPATNERDETERERESAHIQRIRNQ